MDSNAIKESFKKLLKMQVSETFLQLVLRWSISSKHDIGQVWKASFGAYEVTKIVTARKYDSFNNDKSIVWTQNCLIYRVLGKNNGD